MANQCSICGKELVSMICHIWVDEKDYKVCSECFSAIKKAESSKQKNKEKEVKYLVEKKRDGLVSHELDSYVQGLIDGFDTEGLTEEEKESNRMAFSPQQTAYQQTDTITRLTHCPDCNGEVSVRAETCPHCGCPLMTKKESLIYDLKMGVGLGSGYGTFLNVLGWIVLIGGTIISIFSALDVYSSFHFDIFLISFLTYIVYGILMLCMGYVANTVADIHSIVSGLKLERSEKDNSPDNKKSHIRRTGI